MRETTWGSDANLLLKLDDGTYHSAVVWSRGKLRVVVTPHYYNDNTPHAIARCEFNQGPDALGNDAWVQVNAEEDTMLFDILYDLITSPAHLNSMDVSGIS